MAYPKLAFSCRVGLVTAPATGNLQLVSKHAGSDLTSGPADDSEGIGDVLQLLPGTVRDAVHNYLAARAETHEGAGVSKSPGLHLDAYACLLLLLHA